MARKEVQDWVLDRRFKSVPGVIDVTGYGGTSKIFKLEMDPNRLNALHVTQQQVVDAVGRSNGSTGGSYIVQGDEDYMIRGMGLLASVADIRNVVVATTADGIVVHVADVADVSIGEPVRKGQVGMANSKGDRDDVVEGIVLMRLGENPSNVVENGIIVDGAIVMVENVIRCSAELGEEQRKDRGQILLSICHAAKQVVAPVTFTTAIILVFFLPVN